MANEPAGNAMQLPALGYPISADAVGDWFRRTYHRAPTDRELTAVINAMAQRETTKPEVEPRADPRGWEVVAPAAPDTRR